MFYNRESYLWCLMKTVQRSTLATTVRLTCAQAGAWRLVQAGVEVIVVDRLFVKKTGLGICMVLLVLANGDVQRLHILFSLGSQPIFLGLTAR